MANYATSNTLVGTLQAITGTYKSLLMLTAATATLRGGRMYDMTFGTLGTPADQTYEFDVSRQTAAQTASAVVPVPLNPSDAAAGTVGAANATVEGGTITATSSMFSLGINQRASYRWVAAPGSEIFWPATNLAGINLRTRSVSGGTATATAQMYHME